MNRRFLAPANKRRIPGSFNRAGALLVLGLLLLPVFAAVLSVFKPALSSAAASSTLTFQARLLNTNGSLVADGTYNVEFKIYDTVASGASAQGVCSLNSSTDDCWWVENRIGGNKVTVKNGYIYANLGSVTAFSSTIPWDQELWITMNIGGTGSPSWDGEMSPRFKVAAVPYAFAAAKLQVTDTAITNKLVFATPSASNKTITLPNETGTVCTTGSVCSGYASTTGYATISLNNIASTNLSAALNVTSGNLALQTTTSGNINLTPAVGTGLVNVLTGNLQVGNGTPGVTLNGEDLYVEGTLEVDGAQQFDGALVATSTAAFNGGLTIGDAIGDTVTINSGAWTFANDTTVALTGGVNGLNFDSDTLSIDATNDRVGIGTAAPVSLLNIAGTSPVITLSDTQQKVWVLNDILGKLVFKTSDISGIGTRDVGSVRLFDDVGGSASPAGAMSFYVSAQNSNESEAMRISSTGNVGIGTTAPGTKLYINGVTKIANNNSFILADSADANGFTITNNGSNAVSVSQANNQQLTINAGFSANANNNIIFTNDASTERLRIQGSTGNVGIGDTTPASLLTVGASDAFQVNSSGAIAAATGITTSGNFSQTGAGTFSTATGAVSLNGNTTIANGSTLTAGGGVLSVLSNGTVSGLRVPVGTEGVNGTFFSGFLQNELTNIDLRGGTIATAVTGGASIASPNNVFRPGDNASGAIVSFGITGTAQWSVTGITVPTPGRAVWAPYLQMRWGQEPTGILVEYRRSDNVTWDTIVNDTSPVIRAGLWMGADTSYASYPITGYRITLTYTGTAASYVREIGLNNRNTEFGSNNFASLGRDNNFYGSINIANSGTLQTSGTIRLTSAGVLQNVTNADASTFFTGGALTVARGGTGASTFTTNGVLYGNTTGALQVTAASTGANQCLITSGIGTAPIWGSCTAGGGVTTMAAIGAVPNANGATISTNTLTLQPADASFGGVVTTGTQTFAGAKTFNGAGSFTAAGTGLAVTNNATITGTITSGLINGQTISSSANFTGSVTTGGNVVINGAASGPNLQIKSPSGGPWALQFYRTDLGGGPQLYASDISTIYASGNIIAVGTITSGLINGQTISSAANFTGTVNAVTGYKVNGGGASGNYLRGDGTNFVANTIQAGDVPTLNQDTSGYAGTLLREDNRTISPSELTAGRLKFGFTSFANNDSGPYADFLHLRSYTDATGGNDNLVMFRKDAIGLRIYQQAWGSATAYSSYKDAVMTDIGSANVTLTGALAMGANTITSGLINGQTISSAANFTGTLTVASTSTFNGEVQIIRANLTNALYIAQTGDSSAKLRITEDGVLNFGPGNAITDTNLYRSAADTLMTDDALTVSGLLTSVLGATISGATINLNASSNFATNINTGTSSGAISIGNSAAGVITLQSASTIGLTGTSTHTGLSSGSGTALTVSNSTSTGSIFVAQDNSTAVLTVADGGGTIFRNSTNSTTGFQIQDSAGTSNLLVADTSNTKIGIATTPTSSGATVQVVGNVSATTGVVLNATGNSSSTITKSSVVTTAVNINDVVVIDTANAGQVKTTTVGGSTGVFGIATSTQASTGQTQNIVIGGIYQVTANTAAVAIGDQLVTSTTAGQVAPASNPAIGTSIGRALSSKSAGSSGLVWVYVSPGNGGTGSFAMSATGGTITTSGGYTIHTFTTSGTFTPSNTGDVEYLVVAGGGGGGGNKGGGGGAGGMKSGTNFGVTPQAYSITVGAGGAGGNLGQGTNGGDSIFSSITATGGGGGGAEASRNGLAGGSGGGATRTGTAGTGSSGQGSNGGPGNEGGSGIYSGGGGGGASAVGGTNVGTTAGAGGNGTASSISGSSVTYSGGGGGGGYAASGGVTGGTGGTGGGGNGGSCTGTDCNTPTVAPTAGTANTGGGGGGGENGVAGAAGGSGIVIIRYLTGVNTANGNGPQSAKMTRAAAQSIPGSTATKIAFDTEVYDVGDIADPTTNDRFNIKKAGKYLITAQLGMDAQADQDFVYVYIYKNGASVSARFYLAGTGGYVSATNSTTLDLVAGDYIELYTYQSNASAKGIRLGTEAPEMSVVQLDTSGNATTLQGAYDMGRLIATTDGRDITITLSDTITDSNLIVNVASGSTSKFAVQYNGADTFSISNAASAQGSALFKNATNNTTAFVIQNATAVPLVTVDTTNKKLTVATDIIATGASTATTGTTEATARTNVTTVTLTAAGSFANNDVIFLNNAGQDYYTRIVSGGGTTTLTVSPAVSYDVSTAVTKYTVQNIGATATDYATNANKFFQGYFLGGVVTGAGSTTLSDGALNSTGNLVLQSTSGNVGINTGTTAPATKLTVNGGGVFGGTTAGNDTVEVQGAGAGYSLYDRSTGITDRWSIYATGGILRLYENGTGDRFTINQSGNTTVSGTLVVSGASGTINGSNILTLASGTDFITGAKYFQSNKGASSYLGANNTYVLEAFATDGGAAAMSFHRNGAYAVNFGLDPDNVMRIGGWSAAANRWQLDMSGNQWVAGQSTATGFYISRSQPSCWGSGGSDDNWTRFTNVCNGGGVYQDIAIDNLYAAGAQRYDIAEYTPVKESDHLVPGDIVSSDPNTDTQVSRSQVAYDRTAMGIVSSIHSAAMVIGGKGPELYNTDKSALPIALGGRVMVKVSSENGLIERGDAITTSAIPGTGMKITQSGPIVGKSMDKFDPSQLTCTPTASAASAPWREFEDPGINPNGIPKNECFVLPDGTYLSRITVFVTPSWYVPDQQLLAELNVSGPTTLTSLTATGSAIFEGAVTVVGDAEFQGNLTVIGDTVVANITVNGKIISSGDTPTVVLGATTTGDGSSYTIEGNDTAGSITITTGNATIPNPLATGEQATMTFVTPFTATPRITLTPTTEAAGNISYYITKSGTGFKLHFTSTPLPNTIYSFDYQVLQ